MARALPEWIGASDDSAVPPRVRLRVLERFGRRCDPDGGCGRPIRPGDAWTCDHIRALVNGGANRESNLHPLCSWCEPYKTAADVSEKSTAYRLRLRHAGIKLRPKGRPLPGTIASGWRHRINGTWERRGRNDPRPASSPACRGSHRLPGLQVILDQLFNVRGQRASVRLGRARCCFLQRGIDPQVQCFGFRSSRHFVLPRALHWLLTSVKSWALQSKRRNDSDQASNASNDDLHRGNRPGCHDRAPGCHDRAPDFSLKRGAFCHAKHIPMARHLKIASSAPSSGGGAWRAIMHEEGNVMTQISRRAAITALPIAAAGASLAMPAVAESADPIFAVIKAHRRAYEEFNAAITAEGKSPPPTFQINGKTYICKSRCEIAVATAFMAIERGIDIKDHEAASEATRPEFEGAVAELDAHEKAQAWYETACEADDEALDAVLTTRPTTRAGIIAVIDYIRVERGKDRLGERETVFETFLGTIGKAVAEMKA